MKPSKTISIGKPINSLAKIVDSRILSVLTDNFGFSHLSPVQENAIPLLLSEKDPLVQAVTGSGKTLAYLIPVFQLVLKKLASIEYETPGLALIILPTRELANQVHQVTLPFTHAIPELQVDLITGGMSFGPKEQSVVRKYSSPIFIATPGKFVDVIQSSSDVTNVKLNGLQVLILDEADQMLSMGFQSQLDYILARCPKSRRTGLFSATQTSRVSALARSGLSKPVLVRLTVKRNVSSKKKKKKKSASAESNTGRNKDEDVDDEIDEHEEEFEDDIEDLNDSIPLRLENFYAVKERYEKLEYSLNYIQNELEEPKKKVIIFHLTCASVDYYSYVFKRMLPREWTVLSLHGQMNHTRRNKTFSQFKEAKPPCLMICTDVLARGVDIPDIGLVIQHDPPTKTREIVHRIGRTGRFGRTGKSLLLLTKSEEEYVRYVEAILKIRINKLETNELLSSSTTTNTTINEPPSSSNNNMIIKRSTLLERVKNYMLKDRALLDRSEEGFIAFIRAYQKHECRGIFPLSKLNFCEVATEYQLLRRPRIPETRHWKWSQFEFYFTKRKRNNNGDNDNNNSENDMIEPPPEQSEKIKDINNIPYKDTRREKSRQIRNLSKPKKRKKKKKKEGVQKIRKIKSVLKRQKVVMNDDEEEDDDDDEDDDNNKKKKKKKKKKKGQFVHSKSRKKLYEYLETNEMKHEEYYFKQYKRGKLSKSEYERLTGEDKMNETFRKRYNWIESSNVKQQGQGKMMRGKRKKKNRNQKKKQQKKNKKRKRETIENINNNQTNDDDDDDNPTKKKKRKI